MNVLIVALLLLAPQDKRRLPPPGVPVPAADRAELEAGLRELRAELDRERESRAPGARHVPLANVEIFYKAVDWAVRYDEFFNAKEIPVAKEFLKIAASRLKQHRERGFPPAAPTGLLVLGYNSRVDGSVQPYGLVIPETFRRNAPVRLDVWLHGRGETLSELNFIHQRMRQSGEFAPPDAIVLHVYGRYCNAFKFAGETDVFEAIESVKRNFPVDENRVVIRGFSMGGAGCWHLAAHHPGFWAAANPGAGFAETPVYANVARDPVKPAWYHEKLWRLYNATDYAANLFNLPTVAYSGELDKQKQAADIMAEAMKQEGLELTHVIGPKTEHKYEAGAKAEVARRVDEIVSRGREPNPARVRFTTWTLRYNTAEWVTADALEEHWERARLDAERDASGRITVATRNVSAFTLGLPTDVCAIDGQEVRGGPSYHKAGGAWKPGKPAPGLRKRHGLQGPIDDAFMDSFLVVRPTGKPLNEKVGAWTAAEQDRAVRMWRSFFRGDARVKDDKDVTPQDIQAHALVLWGDPSSNQVLARLADKLPIHWDAKGLKVGSQNFGDTAVPVLIYPNPLNPDRYVVLNSGFTFQDQAPLSNSRHVPMLPDWAVVNAATRAVEGAGFFGERWEFK
jgi:hypothetical protein